MILWVSTDHVPPKLPRHSAFPAGIRASISVPPADLVAEPALQYSFITGDTSQPMAPSKIEWRIGKGSINTGRNVLATADYLYDAASGRIGFSLRTELRHEVRR